MPVSPRQPGTKSEGEPTQNILAFNISGGAAGVSINFTNGDPLPVGGFYSDASIVELDGPHGSDPLVTTVTAAMIGNDVIRYSPTTALTDNLTSDGGILAISGTTNLNNESGDSLIVAPGATVYVNGSETFASLTIDAGATVRQISQNTTFGASVITVGSLEIQDPDNNGNDGGVLDLGYGDLIDQPGISPDVSGYTGESETDQIEQWLAAGYDGGGISASDATVDSSTIANNTASQYGGGIYDTGSLTITRSTVSGNTASVGGGIIDNQYCTIDVSACTIANNTADGGSGIDGAMNTTIADSTVSGNYSPGSGAGIYSFDGQEGPTILTGSVISNNTDPDGASDLCGYFAPADDIIASYFVFGGPVYLTTSNQYDFSGYSLQLGVDPQLAPLGYYGGPTETMPPLPGSSALDAFGYFEGMASRSTTDQRGFPMGDDLGAVQSQSNPLQVNSTADAAVGLGQLSLRDAANLAGVMGGNQTITFASSISSTGSATINLSGGPIALDDTTGKITIDGSGSANPITVNAASGSAAFTVVAGSTAEIDGLTIGGAVTTAGTLTLNGDINPTANNFSVEVLDGGTLYLPTSIILASLTIDAGGFAQQTSTDTTFGSEVLTVGALSLGSSQTTINGGVLDLGNGDLIVQDTFVTNIAPLLAAGYDEGLWDGQLPFGPAPACIISSAAIEDPYQIESLGYAQIGTATDEGYLNLSTFDGQTVNTGDAVIALTYYGDANLDRQVNSADYAMIGAQYPYTGTDIGGWTDGDFNYNGVIDSGDSSLIDYVSLALLGLKDPDKIQSDKAKNTIKVTKDKDNPATSDTAKLTCAANTANTPILKVVGANPDLDDESKFKVNLSKNNDGTWSVSVTVSPNCPAGDYDVEIADTANMETDRPILITVTVKAP